jgi:hypothetical protein
MRYKYKDKGEYVEKHAVVIPSVIATNYCTTALNFASASKRSIAHPIAWGKSHVHLN